jgi:hypothetical protein
MKIIKNNNNYIIQYNTRHNGRMSLPTFKLNPTNSQVNSGFSPDAKLKTSGGIQDIISNAKETASSLEFPSLNLSSSGSSSDSGDDSDSDGFFSFTFIIRAILIVIIGWFMWVNLANHGEFNLGVGEKVSDFFKSMEENGKVLYARITGNIADYKSTTAGTADDSSKLQDGGQVQQKRDIQPPTQRSSDDINRNIPVPPSMTNSAEKKPGFNHEDDKYTFLDKASRNYTGPSPSPDDSTSKTQKHQSGKAGYCYIGEDRGFRSCIKVEAGDKCMSGDVFSRPEICMNPSLRE